MNNFENEIRNSIMSQYGLDMTNAVFKEPPKSLSVDEIIEMCKKIPKAKAFVVLPSMMDKLILCEIEADEAREIIFEVMKRKMERKK